MNIEGILLSEWYCSEQGLIHPFVSRLHIMISSCDSPWSFEHIMSEEWKLSHVLYYDEVLAEWEHGM